MLEIIRGLLEREAARIVNYAAAGAVAASVWVAGRLGLELTTEVTAGISAIAVFVATEVIRRLVFSIKTTQAIADRAAVTGNTDIGNPPKGPTPA